MEEQQVEGEVPATDLQRVFGADEAEVAAQLDEKVLEPRQQALMQAEKLGHVGIAEHLQRIGVGLCHQWCHFCRGSGPSGGLTGYTRGPHSIWIDA